MSIEELPRRILIVEDDSRLRSGLGDLLRQNGYEVVAAATGEQGISHLRSETRTDLIVLDLRMPGMNGWQFRSEQRRDSALASIPVIVATA
ncbi:MAG TPA: response regulator, partial [Thermoanaerobaculia bacterium]|nr:response regulator [Thermoanaerobaculia bacterium]